MKITEIDLIYKANQENKWTPLDLISLQQSMFKLNGTLNADHFKYKQEDSDTY